MSEDKSFLKRLLTETWPAKMAQDALKAVMLPGDVYQGKVSMYGDDGRTNPEVINRSADLAGLVTLGAGVVPAEANSLRSGIKAYHGSPHDFEKFDLSKIGTGEGAQAYGRGLYFAENEATAKSYRDLLAARYDATSSEAGLSTRAIANAKRDLPSFNGDISAYIDAQKGRISETASKYSASTNFVGDEFKKLDSLGQYLKAAPSGHMYEVNINSHPDRFLPWDEAITKYGTGEPFSPDLVDRIRSVVPSNKMSDFNHAIRTGAAGEAIYKDILGAHVRHRAPEITQRLSDAGVHGIKYLDQGSRGIGDGTRNYVVFDEGIVDILRKYGLAGASASPLAALMAGQGQGELQQ